MERKIIRISKIPDNNTLVELVEYLVYYHMSYPTGQKDICSILVNDASCEIITPDTTYKLSDEIFLHLYLLSNKAIANIYKTI